jgi:hypothetical protein
VCVCVCVCDACLQLLCVPNTQCAPSACAALRLTRVWSNSVVNLCGQSLWSINTRRAGQHHPQVGQLHRGRALQATGVPTAGARGWRLAAGGWRLAAVRPACAPLMHCMLATPPLCGWTRCLAAARHGVQRLGARECPLLTHPAVLLVRTPLRPRATHAAAPTGGGGLESAHRRHLRAAGRAVHGDTHARRAAGEARGRRR